MPWDLAVAPAECPHPVDLVEIESACLTPYERGELRTADGPSTWVRGAAHDADGVLVRQSQRWWPAGSAAPIAADPSVIRVPSRGDRLDGRWLYAGHMSNHFGHFLVEVVSNLWPEPPVDGEPALDGLVFHQSYHSDAPRAGAPTRVPDLAGWQRSLVERAGYGDLPIRIVRGRPVHVDRLVVPARPVGLRAWVEPTATKAWRRIAASVDGPAAGARRVFLSRSRFNASASGWHVRTSAAWDRHLDGTFADHGFEVVHPEELDIAQQIALAASAAVLAGASGSALHLSVFAPTGLSVLVIGDNRDRAPRTQQALDAACGHRSAYVSQGDEEGLERLLDELDELDRTTDSASP